MSEAGRGEVDQHTRESRNDQKEGEEGERIPSSSAVVIPKKFKKSKIKIYKERKVYHHNIATISKQLERQNL